MRVDRPAYRGRNMRITRRKITLGRKLLNKYDYESITYYHICRSASAWFGFMLKRE